ncbi:translocation/assembly module TamB domain-containing protein [Azorhizobium doebereinerae]|uniref:translocation/assembly module TamB domain-containing protein n=1 Tax=Azorhizobium doebereinerae TaxID=281091 RepID=UPI0004100512|nr:translocation/assembly module TamB domain-containing protein [Azorhizobium doebereinerae]
MRALDLFVRTLFRTVLGLLLVTLLVFGFAQTPPGKALLARLGGSLASGNGLQVTISDLGGAVPWDMTAGEITLADPQGTFARVENLRLAWSPSSLLSGIARIRQLDAGVVEVLRRPELPPATGGRSGGVPAIRLVLDKLQMADIRLAEPVLGQAAQLSAEASATLMEPAQGISLAFRLTRTDTPGSLSGNVRYVPDSRSLDVDMEAHEPAGGLFARLARLEGLPAVDAELRGIGPLDGWQGSLKLSAGSVLNVQANAWIMAEGSSYRLTFALDGDVSKAVPAPYAPLLEGRTSLSGEARVGADLQVNLGRLSLQAAAGTLRSNGLIDARNGHVVLTFNAGLTDAPRAAALLPGVGFKAVEMAGTLDGSLATPRVVATLTGTDLSAAGYSVGAATTQATLLPDAAGNLTFELDGTLDRLGAQDRRVAAALGDWGTFSAIGTLPKGGAPALTRAQVALSPLNLSFTGRASTADVTGTLAVERLDLAALSPLAGRPLAGTVRLDGQVSTPAGGGFAAQISGEAKDFDASDPVLNGLVGRTARFDGGASYGADGAIAVRDLKLAAGGLDLSVNGRIDHAVADLSARLALADLARLDTRLSGRLDGTAAFSGTLDALAVKARLALPRGTAMGREVRDLTVDLAATDLTRLPGGALTAAGSIGGKPLRGMAGFASMADGARSLRGLDLSLGAARATGDVTLAPSGLLAGRLQLAAPDVSDLSALALAEMGGAVTAAVTFDADAGRQRIALKANASRLTAPGVSLERGDFDLTATDPARAPALTGRAALAGLDSNGLRVERATLDAAPGGANATNLKLDALVQGTAVTAGGRLATEPGRAALRLDALRLANGGTVATLSAPATLSYADGTLAVDRLALASGGGTAVIQGRAGDRLDLSVDVRNLPLALAGLAAPTQGLTGSFTGQAQLSGPVAAPTGRYTVALTRISQPELQRAGVGPLDFRAEGAFADGRVTIRSTLAGPSLSGVTLNGSAPLGAGALDLAVRGQVSLAIANAMLAASGARATGTAAIDATLRGTTASPSAGGTVRISGGRYDDALNGVTLSNIDATLTGTDRSVTLSSFSARTPNGGSLTGRGRVDLDPAAGFPGQAEVTLQNAGLVTNDLMRLVADGRVTLGGALATRPTVGGRIDVRNLDINVPDRLTSSGAQIDVRHVNVPPGAGPSKPRASQANGGRAGRGAQPARAQGPMVASLDLTIAAANRVFVRGMGIDAELGGELNLRGTSAEPIATGGFQLRRGRFDILGRRLDFSRGVVTFRGSTDPELDFAAESTASDVTASVQVTGPASHPDITFSSSPALPQDEVIARLLFGKATGQLSTGQALQLAQTIAQFSGGGAGLDQLRRQFGLDSLDVGANSEGNGGEVGFGRRINDRVYLGVRQGTTTGSSRATIDVDVTKNIRIQGGAGADGSGEVGIGAQWDY